MIRSTAYLAVALALAAFPAAAQERMGADVTCKQVEKTMAYDCLIMLKGMLSGHPIQGAAVVVGADMPAHPMAHNVRPVKAEATGKPGEYKFRIVVEMHGEWALKIRLAKPRQDIIVQKVMFAPATN